MPFHADPSTPNLSDISYFCDENPLTPSTIPGIPDITTPDLSGISDLTEVNGVMLNSSLFHANPQVADTQNHGIIRDNSLTLNPNAEAYIPFSDSVACNSRTIFSDKDSPYTILQNLI